MFVSFITHKNQNLFAGLYFSSDKLLFNFTKIHYQNVNEYNYVSIIIY